MRAMERGTIVKYRLGFRAALSRSADGAFTGGVITLSRLKYRAGTAVARWPRTGLKRSQLA